MLYLSHKFHILLFARFLTSTNVLSSDYYIFVELFPHIFYRTLFFTFIQWWIVTCRITEIRTLYRLILLLPKWNNVFLAAFGHLVSSLVRECFVMVKYLILLPHWSIFLWDQRSYFLVVFTFFSVLVLSPNWISFFERQLTGQISFDLVFNVAFCEISETWLRIIRQKLHIVKFCLSIGNICSSI